MKYKKIYVEITNKCNLKCSFCKKTNRKPREMTTGEFETIMKKINKYTDYIYLHVKGEPLIHKNLDEILNITNRYNKKVCITTNGVYLKERIETLKKYENIYQINISLHSENKKENYIEDVFYSVDNLKVPYISYRFWTLDKGQMDEKLVNYCKKIKEKYNKNELHNGIKLDDKTFVSIEDKFEWPDIKNNYIDETGTCLGGKTHLAILSNGEVSICCLDDDGESNLGNIFTSSFEDIITSNKYKKIIKGFNDRKVVLDICKHCKYKNRFIK